MPKQPCQRIPIFLAPLAQGIVPSVIVPAQGANKGHPELLCQPLTLPLTACTHLLTVYQGHNQASVPRRLWDCPHTPAGPYQAPLGTAGSLVVTGGTCLLLFIF